MKSGILLLCALFSCVAFGQNKALVGYPLGANLSANGAVFRVWAPNATRVSVKTDSSRWHATQLQAEGATGVWSARVPNAEAGDHYVYSISRGSSTFDRPDPEGRQLFQNIWSVLLDPNSYKWKNIDFVGSPIESAVIYELHIGSFNPGTKSWGSYLSIIEKLDYLSELGINYIEILPLHKSARPFDWGYGVSLPSALEDSYGSADEFKQLVDAAHQHGIGVLIDVVHNHYSRASALICFDGDCQGGSGSYFYDEDHGQTPWGPRPNFANAHVRDFIANDIRRYVNEYHVDGFRWDATPYITTYLDTEKGGKKHKNNGDNPDGISLLKEINQELHRKAGILNTTEYFNAPDSVTTATTAGGLGFDSHWQGLFSVVQAITQYPVSQISIQNIANNLAGSNKRVIFTESHDEVGHPPRQRRIPTKVDEANPSSVLAQKRSLLGAAIVMTTPGIPMIFQGQEFLEAKDFTFPTGTPLEWSNTTTFSGIVAAYHDLISLRKNTEQKTAALMASNVQVFHLNEAAKVLAYSRGSAADAHQVVVVANFGNQSFPVYRIGLPRAGNWSVLFSSDDNKYSDKFGGSPHLRKLSAENIGYDGFPKSVQIELAPFTAVVLINEISLAH